MLRPDPWKLGTLTFAGTTLLLGALLFTQAPQSNPSPGPHTVDADEGSPPPVTTETRPRRRVEAPTTVARASEPKEPVDPSSVAPDATPPWKAALDDDRDVGEILKDHVFDRDGESPVRAPFDDLIARLRKDEGRSVALLEDWIRRRYEVQRAGYRLTGFPPALFSAYAELKGEAAIPLLRSLVPDPTDLQAWTVIAPLIRAGDQEVIRRLDAKQRAGTGNDFLDPKQIAWNGESAVALVRAWSETATNPGLKVHSRRALWEFGTEDDRERLWASADETERFGNFYTGPGHPWWDRVRDQAQEALDSDDPWLRVLAARWMQMSVGAPGIDAGLVARIAASDARGPCPPGRDPKRWNWMVSKLGEFLEHRREEEEARRRLREVLGLE